MGGILAAAPLMLGGQLAVTAEPFEDGGITVGLNVLPVVLEWAATPRVGLRATSILNMQFAGESSGLSHRGAGLTVPVYLPGKNDTAPFQGFYLGPYVGYTRNPLVDGWDVSLAGEGGVRWEVADRLSLNLALQLGASRLDRPTEDRWVQHFGFYPSLGYWFR